MKILAGVLLVALGALQYKIWLSDSGFFERAAFHERVAGEARKAELLRYRNRLLTAEVLALKDGLAAVEARARADLGMVKEGEVFYVVADAVNDAPSPGPDAR